MPEDVIGIVRFSRRHVSDFKWAFIVVVDGVDTMLRQYLAVNNDILAVNLDMVARNANNALHIIRNDWLVVVARVVARWIVFIAWVFEDDDIPSLYLALWQKRKRLSRSKNELIDEQVITDGDRVFHRTGWHLDRLHNERHAEQRHDDRYNSGFKVFTPQRFRRTFWLHLLRCGCFLAVAMKDS